MTETFTLRLGASKIYVSLTLSIYAISAFAAWHYAPYFWLSMLIIFAILISLYRFLPAILLTQPESVVQITLNQQQIIVQKNNAATEQYAHFNAVYQSRFLVIIQTGKKYVLVFRDAVEPQSLSTLNRILNVKS